jgi:AcrR family transcriptional regulator
VGRERLTRARILVAALRLVDDEGMAALSMRRLGAELGVDPMAVYHHVPGKDAVVSGLVEKVFSEMRLPPYGGPPGGGAWRDLVRAWARAYRDVVRSHPNLVLQVVSDAAAASEAVILVSEPLYGALEEAGLPPLAVVRASDLVADYVNGFALAEASQPPGEPYDRRELLARVQGKKEGLPAMARVFGALAEHEARYDFDSGFDAGLDIILAGIEASA